MCLFRVFKKKDEWQYGSCRNRPARKHLKKGNVQFIIWYKGDQKNVDGFGHLEDVWIDFDESYWHLFIPN